MKTTYNVLVRFVDSERMPDFEKRFDSYSDAFQYYRFLLDMYFYGVLRSFWFACIRRNKTVIVSFQKFL